MSNWNSVKVNQKKTAQYWIDKKFSRTERAFIKEAIVIAVEALQDRSIWQEVRSNYGFAYPKNITLSKSGLCDNTSVRRNLLFHQLSLLSSNSRDISFKRFPNIYIYYKNAPPKTGKLGWVGYAYYNKVGISWDFDSKKWNRTGDFQLYLNQHFLKKGGLYNNKNYWAGTIAHEILHNLGHQHPSARHKNYDRFQINVLANAVRSYGLVETAGDIEYPVHTCRLESDGIETAGDIN